MNNAVLPENGATAVPRNALIWLSAETVLRLAGSVANDPAALDAALHQSVQFYALEGEPTPAFDITHLDGHTVLHPQQLLAPGEYVLRIYAAGVPVHYSTFTVDQHVDLEASAPPVVSTSSAPADDPPGQGGATAQGGAGGEAGALGHPTATPASWAPSCRGSNATPLTIESADPILLTMFDGGEPLAVAIQSGDAAASYLVRKTPELVPLDHELRSTSCFVAANGPRNMHAGSYDLAGNFSGWAEVTQIVVDAPFSDGAGGFHDYGYCGPTGPQDTYCDTGGPPLDYVTGGTAGYDDPVPRRDSVSGCACSAASGGSKELLFAGAALVLGLFLARHAMRVARRAP